MGQSVNCPQAPMWPLPSVLPQRRCLAPPPAAGVAYRARTGCVNAECVYQGNQVVGNAINGCAASGATAAMGFYSAKPIPARDSNQVRHRALQCAGGGVGWVGRRGKVNNDI